MSSARDGLPRSVQTRLARHARAINTDPNLVLTRYAVERFLYRLSRTSQVDRFVLKGALLMLAWLGDTLRPTRDADLLGLGDLSDASLATLFAEVCSVAVEPDGMVYLADTVRVEPIRTEDAYGGRRVSLDATLGAARLRVQVDVGIGDAVVPPAAWLDYPSLLDLPRPQLRAYAAETVVAEKFHAIVVLGFRNSRMKDYFDLHALSRGGVVTPSRVDVAIEATFARRKTSLPDDWPPGLSDAFVLDAKKQAQWNAFLSKNRLDAPSLNEVVVEIRRLLEVPLAQARESKPVARYSNPRY